MKVYADTSFLASLYLRDINSPAALAWVRPHGRALVFTALQRHELRNAIHLTVFRGGAAGPDALAALAKIDRDVADGKLDACAPDWGDVFHEAERLGDILTARHGLRSLDLLHLGAARSLGARTILTFDQHQQAAARAAGFQTGP